MPIPIPSMILLAFASVTLLAGRWSGIKENRAWFVAVLVALVAAGIGLLMTPIITKESAVALTQRPVWTNDPLAVCEQWLILTFGFLSALSMFDARDVRSQSPLMCGYLLFALTGLLFVAQANDLVSLALALEVIRRSVMGLQSCDHSSQISASNDSINVRFQPGQMWLSGLAVGFVWLGIALLSTTIATTQFDGIQAVLATTYESTSDSIGTVQPSRLPRLAVGMVVLGLLAECGFVPFQSRFCGPQTRLDWRWTFCALAGPLAGLIASTRLLGSVFVGMGPTAAVLIMSVGLATFAVSAAHALRSLSPGVKSIRLFLASLLQLQCAWQSVGLITVTMELTTPGSRWGAFASQPETLGLVVFGQLSFVLTLTCLVNVLAHLGRTDRDIEFLEDLKGLCRYSPWMSTALTLGLITSVGGPLTIGFWSRWWMMLAASNVHFRSSASEFSAHDGVRLLMFAGLLATAIVFVVVVRIAREMYFESPLAQPAAAGGRGVFIAAVVTATACLLFGLFPQALLQPLSVVSTPRLSPVPTFRHGSGSNAVGSVQRQQTIVTEDR